jgi:predicted secreted protein with PEFG-CTERM motif
LYRKKVLKIPIFVILAVSFAPLFAFAEPSIELTSDQDTIGPLDSILVYGKITGVAPYSTVTLTVKTPDGEVVYSPKVTFDNDGVFKRLFHPTLPSFKPGVYTIIASHEKIPYIAELQFTVTSDNLPSSILGESAQSGPNRTNSDMYISADTMNGDTVINIKGHTVWTDRDVSLTVSSPSGNLITVAQLSPTINGDFSTKIKIGGSLWKEDGAYTVTAHQGDSSELQYTTKVEIANGVVVPEFGAIAAMILAVSIISVIALSAKSRLIARI